MWAAAGRDEDDACRVINLLIDSVKKAGGVDAQTEYVNTASHVRPRRMGYLAK